MGTNGKPNNKTALVTGASSGIGLELAKLLARDGYNLVLVARSEGKLHQLAAELEKRGGISARVIVKDLAQPDAPDEIFGEFEQQEVNVDVLVNNAGFTVFGPFVENSLHDELELLQVNVVALTHLTKLFLGGMVERRQGRILNLASTAAFEPGPLMAVYYASKAYVLSFSIALAVELEGTGVTVTALCPGLTATGFQKRGNMEDSRLMATGVMSAKRVAEAGYRALMRGQTISIPGPTNWLFVEAMRFVPRKLAARIVKVVQDRV